jgi:hypothetical protein
MGTDTIKSGLINDDNGVLMNLPSPFPPFQKGHGVYSEELIVNTDFTSGNDVVFEFEGSAKILYAHFTSHVGATIAYVEADVGGTVLRGRKLTLSAVATNIKAYVVYGD